MEYGVEQALVLGVSNSMTFLVRLTVSRSNYICDFGRIFNFSESQQ